MNRGAGSRAGLAIPVAVMLTCAACGSADGTVTVLAASSLTDVMSEVESQLESADPGLDLQISYAGSSQIVQQVNEGIDADVLLLAGETALAGLDAGAQVAEPVYFATNTLAIAVAPGNPAGVTSVADLGRDDVLVVLCAEQVPCGAAAATMFEQAGATPGVDSYEPDVRAVLSKIAAGEADAGIVYVTDVGAATPPVEAIDIPDDVNVVNRYPALVVGDSEAGAAVVADLQTPQVTALFEQAGFGLP